MEKLKNNGFEPMAGKEVKFNILKSYSIRGLLQEDYKKIPQKGKIAEVIGTAVIIEGLSVPGCYNRSVNEITLLEA